MAIDSDGGMTQATMVARCGRQWWHNGHDFHWRRGRIGEREEGKGKEGDDITLRCQ